MEEPKDIDDFDVGEALADVEDSLRSPHGEERPTLIKLKCYFVVVGRLRFPKR